MKGSGLRKLCFAVNFFFLKSVTTLKNWMCRSCQTAAAHCKGLKHTVGIRTRCPDVHLWADTTQRSGAEPAWHKCLMYAFVALSSTGRKTNRGAGLLYLYSLLVSVGCSPRLPWCHLLNPETMRRRISIFPFFFPLSLSFPSNLSQKP